MNKRDDFKQSTKELIAKRSGYLCAFPGCRRMTIAGSEDQKSGLTITGVAAHITAASENGPRYDRHMSSPERASETNGIWTCQIHGKFIDDNPSECTTENLRRWKACHEKWVFERVKSGKELFNKGVSRLTFANVGMFSGEHSIPFGRHNVLVGPNESGKTTICQMLSAFSGGYHWKEFDSRFKFSKQAANGAYIEAFWNAESVQKTIRLSPQFFSNSRKFEGARQRIHIEVNGQPSVDWPRTKFRIIKFENQLNRDKHSDPKNSLIKAIRYLAKILNTQEDLIWDALREELFTSSTFGNRIKRIGHRRVEILVPNGRTFFLPFSNLSGGEKSLAFLDVAMKLTANPTSRDRWIYIFDSGFFGGFDRVNKKRVFQKIISKSDQFLQTFFCLNSKKDTEILTDLQKENWINFENLENLTLHSFL